MEKIERTRRILITSLHFLRNYAFYNAGESLRFKEKANFWVNIDSNFIDIAVLEWMKVFGEWNGKHHWRKVIEREDFKSDLISSLGMNEDQFSLYVDSIKTYRDKFVAHLDERNIMDIPDLAVAKKASLYLVHEIIKSQPTLNGTDSTPEEYYTFFKEMALSEYSGITKLTRR